jgi:tetratricopeptide (TPR) repeat protein
VRLFAISLVSLWVLCGAAWAAKGDAAHEHYRRGSNFFEHQRYEAALKEYEAAFAIKQEPASLFQMAQCYAYLGDYDKSISSFRSYLKRSPRAANHTEVETRIAELEALAKKTDTRVTTPTPPPVGKLPLIADPIEITQSHEVSTTSAEHINRAGRGKMIGGLILTAVGVVTGGFGISSTRRGLDYYSLARENRYNADLDHDSQVAYRTGISLTVIGAVAFAAGAVLQGLGWHEAFAARSDIP